jgi:excisionase family DNA binding protein
MSSARSVDLLAEGAVTVKGAVREFGIGRSRLYEMMGRGELPYSQVGTRRLIPRVALRQLIAAGMVGGASDEQRE